jgi:hypothetical protein
LLDHTRMEPLFYSYSWPYQCTIQRCRSPVGGNFKIGFQVGF